MKKIFPIFILFLIIGASIYYIVRYQREEEISRASLLGWPEEATLKGLPYKEASYYEQLGQGIVQCHLCPNQCILSEGQRGICRVRENIGGKLYSLNYGKPVTIHLDPIEKKPFFHFLPGSLAFSIATVGCNMRCLYCQNWQIAQVSPEDVQSENLSPEEIVERALGSGAKSIAFTYSEPVVFYEYMLETARLARQKGLKSVVITAGYINPEPLRELCQYVDAIKIDLKAFKQSFYDKMTSGQLEPILRNLKIIKEQGIWLEIVNLVIPGENDGPEEIREMAEWIKENLGDEVPLHFTRFYPMYKLQNLPPTPEETLKKARQIALDVGLKYVYTGNIGNRETESTYCPESGELVIERQGYFITKNNLQDGQCQNGEKIPGVWE